MLTAKNVLTFNLWMLELFQKIILILLWYFCSIYSNRVEQAKLKANLLNKSGWTIAFQWIPSHCDVPGNEKADYLAKQGCHLEQPPTNVTCSQAVSKIICSARSHVRQTHEINARGKLWESLLKNRIPMNLHRGTFAANFRISTGHDYLNGHLHRIGVKESPACPLCSTGEIMTFTHLTSCASLANENFNFLPLDNFSSKASLYWAARREMVFPTDSST